jgi:hypothetical protein
MTLHLCDNLLLPSLNVSSASDVARLDLLLGKGIIFGSHFVQIGTLWVITANILDKGRAVL